MNDIIAKATVAQHRASNPQSSFFVSANAGSGKTSVLTQRIARLLLHGVNPARILCLTYTKAAASEVQNRIFDVLAKWVLYDDDRLGEELARVGEAGEIKSERLKSARQLFVKALETPGGLKVQTIHAFCASILKRFPLEAGVSPSFQEMNESESEELFREARDAIFLENPDKVENWQTILPLHDDRAFIDVLSKFSSQNELNKIASQFGDGPIETNIDDLNVCLSQILKKFNREPQFFDKAQKAAWERSKIAIEQSDFGEALKEFRAVFFTGHKLRARVEKARQSEANTGAEDLELIESAISIIEKYNQFFFWNTQFELYKFGFLVSVRYQLLKTKRGLLDYDDLIDKASALLCAQDKINWVMFRLDGNIDHILVDEAQDTNPKQWKIIDALVEQLPESDSQQRSVFIVGDYKQSIFGFQGANSDIFLNKREEYSQIFKSFDMPFEDGEMATSFRSSPLILEFVDHIFKDRFSEGVSKDIEHFAAQEHKSGEVELWSFIEEVSEKKEPLWPNGQISPKVDTEVKIAHSVAAKIAAELAQKKMIEDEGQWRSVRPSDYLILVRKRKKFYEALQSELQRLNVPIAGVDQLRLNDELAIKDIMSILRYIQSPFDQFSLACFLKSPFCNLDDSDLFKLTDRSPNTSPNLEEAMKANTEKYGEILSMIAFLRDKAYQSRPYDLIAAFLAAFDGEARLRKRLGPSVQDAIASFLDLALSYEAQNTPSILGFVNWFDKQELRIKREFESRGDAVRVMTSHGAKGLEAPIVICPFFDYSDKSDNLVNWPEGPIYVKDIFDGFHMPKAIQEAHIQNKLKAQYEERRLLYVALTRAQSRLWLICSGKIKNSERSGSFTSFDVFEAASRALEKCAGVNDEAEFLEYKIQTKRIGAFEQAIDKEEVVDRAPPVLKLKRSQFAQHPKIKTVGLSDIIAETGPQTNKQGRGAAFGNAVHYLIENWRSLDRAGSLNYRVFTDVDVTEALCEARSVVQKHSDLFASDLLHEVPIVYNVRENLRVRGRLDALKLSDDRIRIVDFKTDHIPIQKFEDLSSRYQEQLSFYWSILKNKYPNHKVTAEIIWTIDGSVCSGTQDQLTHSFQNFCARL